MFYILFLCLLPESKRGLCIVQCLIGLSFGARNLFDGIVHFTSSLPSCASYFFVQQILDCDTSGRKKIDLVFPFYSSVATLVLEFSFPEKVRGWVVGGFNDAVMTLYVLCICISMCTLNQRKNQFLSTETLGA